MEKQLKEYMGNVDEVVTLFKQKVKRIEDERDALQARCDKYEKALKEIGESTCDYEDVNYKQLHSTECRACRANEALSSEGKEVENG
jgi:malate synthase